jgi:hypothetical protein
VSVSRDENGYDADHGASDLIVGDLETEWVAARRGCYSLTEYILFFGSSFEDLAN